MRNCLYFALILTAGCAHENHHLGDDQPVMPWGGDTSKLGRPPTTPKFIEDDYLRALQEANARHVPIFVDAWASWCHSCVSLKNFVFTDARIASETSHFVWLSVDTENAKNADFLAKFPNAVLPTLRVVDPQTEQASWTWEGTLTALELVDALKEVRGESNERSQERAEDASVMQLSLGGNNAACAKAATDLLRHLPKGTQRVDVAVTGTGCATELPKDQSQKYLPQLLDELKKITSDTSLPILADDRSGAFEALVDADQTSGDKKATMDDATAWAKFLEGEAANAKSPAERAVFDPHRLLAYLALGEAERALPMLLKSAHDFPNDYNPWARLARAYLELGRFDDAVEASDRALSLAHGPRRTRIALVKADALSKKGDVAGERKTLEEARAFLATLPPAQASAKMKSALDERIAKIDASKGAEKKAPARR